MMHLLVLSPNNTLEGKKYQFQSVERKPAVYLYMYFAPCGPGSSVSIAKGYGLDGPRIETRWEIDYTYMTGSALGPNQRPVQWVRCLSQRERAAGT